MHKHHAAWIEIDCAQFVQNLQAIRKLIPKQTAVCLPLKANAYGHGLAPLAQIAQPHVDYFSVSCLTEGLALQQQAIYKPILVLGAIDEQHIEHALLANLEITLSSPYKAKLVNQVATQLGCTARVHLEIDTGMQRSGVRTDSFVHFFTLCVALEQLTIVGIYSHLATADRHDDPTTVAQIEAFDSVTRAYKQRYPHICLHLANSPGCLNYPASHYDMVRPGLLAFGHGLNASARACGFAPFFSLKSRISFFKVVAPATGISYGHTYTTSEQTRLITVPVGYGDGYRRCLSNKAPVLIRHQVYHVTGTICMDQFMVDIGQNTAYVGDEVVLIGQQGRHCIAVETLATLCNTISYEILCGFNHQRLERRYINWDEPAYS